MGIWTVHTPPGAAEARPAQDHTVFVREGFNFAALVLGPLWVLWHRLWLVLALWLAGTVAIATLDRLVPGSAGVVMPLFALWFALSANDFRRWTLARRGWPMAGIVHAASRELAEKRFFETARDDLTAKLSAATRPLPFAVARGPAPQPGGLPPVIGFPEARP